MKRRSLIGRLIDKLKGRTAPAAQSPETRSPEPAGSKSAKKKNTGSSFEPLENRIAPATLVNATTVTYKDIDGDLVTVKFSKPVFTGSPDDALLTALTMFTFKDENGGTTHITGNNNTGEQLQLLAIDSIVVPGAKNPLAGASITITATKQNGIGNDYTDVGYIRVTPNPIFGVSLGQVSVDGDLGQIDVGDPNGSVALKSLKVRSIGAAGLASQGANGSLESTFTGSLDALIVTTDIVDASLKAVKGLTAKTVGKFGSISIGGSLKTSAGNSSASAGSITSETDIGSIKIGMLIGGAGTESGRIEATGAIGNVTITGDIRGGAGDNSGEIAATKAISGVQMTGSLWAGTGDDSGRITSGASIGAISLQSLHGDQTADAAAPGDGAGNISTGGRIGSLTFRGGLLGGPEDNTGLVAIGGTLGSLIIGESLQGAAGDNSGSLSAAQIGTITITRIISGGTGDGSGSITSGFSIGTVTIKNTLNATAAILGNTGDLSGSISADGRIGTIKIAGSIDGTATNSGEGAASIQAGGGIAAATISGALKGGAGPLSGSIASNGALGTFNIAGNITGGSGTASGSIVAAGSLASMTLAGGLLGGAGADSGSIIIGSDPSVDGEIGKLSIAGGINGAAGQNSGSVRAVGKILNFTLGAKATVPAVVLAGGSGDDSGTIFSASGIAAATINGHVMGGAGLNSGSIFAEGTVAKVTVTGELRGGTGTESGSIRAFDRPVATGIAQGTLGTILVGSVVGGDGARSAQIFADGSLGSFTTGGIVGGTGPKSASILVGQGQSALDDDFAGVGGAKSITIRGALSAGIGAGSGAIETGGSLLKLEIGGAVSGSGIAIGRDLGAAVIGGAVSASTITAFGKSSPTAQSDVAIAKLTINSSVSNSQILAGYDRFGTAANGNAQIGAVTVLGNWTASSLVAGVQDANGDGFGNADDTVIAGGTISSIAAIVITGNVTGTAVAGDHFGFIAQTIAKAKIAGASVALTAAKDTIPLAGTPSTDDTTLREIP